METEKPSRDIRLSGHWRCILHRGNAVVQEVAGKNVVTTNGKDFLAAFLNAAAGGAATFTMRYVAVGTDATAEAAAQTALGAELARVSGVVSYVSGAIYQVTATFASGVGTGAIVEYGLFSTLTSSAGTMLTRDTESVINKGANDTLTVVHQITLS